MQKASASKRLSCFKRCKSIASFRVEGFLIKRIHTEKSWFPISAVHWLSYRHKKDFWGHVNTSSTPIIKVNGKCQWQIWTLTLKPIYKRPLAWILVAKKHIVMALLHLIYYICGTGIGIKIVVLHINSDSIIEKVRLEGKCGGYLA